MSSFAIIEYFDIIEHVLTGFIACFICFPSDLFSLEQVEEALCNCIIITVSTAAHTGLQIVIVKERSPHMTGKL